MYEIQARQHLEMLGLIHISSNIIVPGGEVDLLMQSSVRIEDRLLVGELCIIEVKGRTKQSEWNTEIMSMRKIRRWQMASKHVLWRVEDGEWYMPLSLTGIQLVFVWIENQQLEVNWHAIDLDLG